MWGLRRLHVLVPAEGLYVGSRKHGTAGAHSSPSPFSSGGGIVSIPDPALSFWITFGKVIPFLPTSLTFSITRKHNFNLFSGKV